MSGWVFESERLRYRCLTPDDAETLRAACDDPIASRMMITIPHPYTLDLAREFLESPAASGDAGRLFVGAFEGDALVGTAALFGVGEPEGGLGELGFMVTPEHRGKGYGVEIAAAASAHALSPSGMGWRKLIAECIGANAASARALLAAGFAQEGVRREYELNNGVIEDVLFFGMFREDARPEVQ